MQTDTTQHKAFPHDSVQHVHFRLYAKYEIIQTYKWNLICSSITDRDTGKFKYFKIYVYNLWFMSICQIDTRYWLPKIDTNPGHLKSWFFVNSPSYRNLTISSCWGVNASAEPLLLDLGYPRFPFTWCWL